MHNSKSLRVSTDTESKTVTFINGQWTDEYVM